MIRIAVLLCCLAAALPALAGIDVKVRGLGSEEEDNVYAQIGILDYARRVDSDKVEYDPAEVQRRFKQGEQDIRNALQPFGWYNTQIKSELRGAKPDWTAIYTVDAGLETDVTKLEILIDGPGKDDSSVL